MVLHVRAGFIDHYFSRVLSLNKRYIKYCITLLVGFYCCSVFLGCAVVCVYIYIYYVKSIRVVSKMQ